MKKNNFKKIFVVFSLCVFLLSMFSISSFALNISDFNTGYLYKFEGALPLDSHPSVSTISVNGYVVDKSSGDLKPFTSLQYGVTENSYYFLHSLHSADNFNVVDGSNVSHYVYIDYTDNTSTKEDVESVFSRYFKYSVSPVAFSSLYNNVNIALVGGTNSEGVAFDGLLGMISKFGKFLVSSPLLLVLCIALPLVSFSVGLIIRIKNRA